MSLKVKLSPYVVHCKREQFDVYIGRPSKWGNPFIIGKDGTREEVINKYEEWLLSQKDLIRDLNELKGKVLGCWCRPEKCHGDILIKYVLQSKSNLLEKENYVIRIKRRKRKHSHNRILGKHRRS